MMRPLVGMDAAFLSRFPVRINWDIDHELESQIVANAEWLGRVRAARTRARAAGLKVLIDTRAEADTPEGKVNRGKMIELARASGSKAIADQMFPKLVAPATPGRHPRIAAELHHQYLLAFTPAALDGATHTIDVRVKQPDMTVRARKTYVATPER